jgi:LDH2 family malate/lactate/ureidoglycolate dehydrogenase
MSAHVVHAESLERFVTAVVERVGAEEDIAREVAVHLVRANLSGHDSHGVARIPQYLMQIDRGELIASARPVVTVDSGAGALVDAQRGFGQFSTAFALDWALERARDTGIAAVAVRHSMHIGRLGEYTERATDAGVIGIVTAGAFGAEVGGMGLPGARGRFFSTNPWSFGFPGETCAAVFDGSTSTVAEGKVRLARATGQVLPEGCVVDPDGNPSRDPEDFYAGGALLPLGGEAAGHKGYGLALASALLSGLAMVDDPSPTLIGSSIAGDGDPRGRVAGIFVLVIDPRLFASRNRYHSMVEETLETIQAAPASKGSRGPMVPGQPESAMRRQRREKGITLPAATWRDLDEAGERFGVSLQGVV